MTLQQKKTKKQQQQQQQQKPENLFFIFIIIICISEIFDKRLPMFEGSNFSDDGFVFLFIHSLI